MIKAIVAAGVALMAIGALPSQADAGDQARLLSLTNQVRSAQGLPGLTLDAQLSSVAQAWAAQMAGRGVISHNASLPSQVTGWKLLGENVGVGGTVDAVHTGFVASPTHLENIVDPAFSRIGFGIVRPDARIFVVEVFMKPAPAVATSAAVSTPAAPAATPVAVAPAAAPSATPAPASELSAWMVHSLVQTRSMESAKAA